jgi:hypothetical protein
VSFIAALLAVKVALAIATSSRRLAAAVLGAKALHAGPCLDQRAVDREMIVRQQRFDRPLAEHRSHELSGDVTLDQALAVLGEHRFVPNLVIQRQPDKPAEQQIVVELLHHLLLRTHRVEGLQQQSTKQPLGGNRRSAKFGVQLLELRRQRRQRLVHNLSDRSQRMIFGNPRLAAHVAEQRVAPLIPTAHRTSPYISSRCADCTQYLDQ